MFPSQNGDGSQSNIREKGLAASELTPATEGFYQIARGNLWAIVVTAWPATLMREFFGTRRTVFPRAGDPMPLTTKTSLQRTQPFWGAELVVGASRVPKDSRGKYHDGGR